MTPLPTTARLTLDPATTDETLATIFSAQRHDPERTPAQLQAQREAGVALIAALRPRDPVEAVYAARAAAAHFGAMECFRRAMLPDMPDNAALRWYGKAMALSRMNTEMIRVLKECQAATPGAQPQLAAQPAAQPAAAASPSPAVVETARRAAANATRAVGAQYPMPSERAPSAPPVLPAMAGPAPAAPLPVASPPAEGVRAGAVGSNGRADGVLAAAA